MRITIETIPHDQQRYSTLGDWFWTGDDLTIRVSESGDWRSDVLVALHEFVEVYLCKDAGITQQSVDEFDKAHLSSDDPGDEIDAPYRDQHCFAMAVERMMAAAMHYPWLEHEDTLAAVETGQSQPRDYPAVKDIEYVCTRDWAIEHGYVGNCSQKPGPDCVTCSRNPPNSPPPFS